MVTTFFFCLLFLVVFVCRVVYGRVVSFAVEAEAFVWAGLEIITCHDEETTALLVARLNQKYYEETVYFTVVGALEFLVVVLVIQLRDEQRRCRSPYQVIFWGSVGKCHLP